MSHSLFIVGGRPFIGDGCAAADGECPFIDDEYRMSADGCKNVFPLFMKILARMVKKP